MDGLLRNIFGAQKPVAPSGAADDPDFADFAGAPDPSPALYSAGSPAAAGVAPAFPTGPGASSGVVYTKWYRVWERTSPSDFYNEYIILVFIIVLVGVYLWGTKTNRRIAKKWVAIFAPLLDSEFAVVGYGGRKAPSLGQVESMGLAKASESDDLVIPEEILREKTPQEFMTYASGRQNVAFVDLKLTLFKRYNPLTLIAEFIASFFFETITPPAEKVDAVLYPFDGREAALVHVGGGKLGEEIMESKIKGVGNSTYDGFVWAIVNKDIMKQLRDDRYDLSLTSTKDNSKLPIWATIMSESAEVTELLLTPDLIKAIESAGDLLDYLIVTDQPLDKPVKLDETIPRKRIHLSFRLPPSSEFNSIAPLFSYFLRMSDQLVAHAHFRAEVMRKVRSIRDEEIRKLTRADEDSKNEERTTKRDKEKKQKRENMLKGMSADEQRKFLDKEREKDLKKSQKKMTRKG